jgi:hypothetical protein
MVQWADGGTRVRLTHHYGLRPTEGIMDERSQDTGPRYEPPELRSLGAVADVTQAKSLGGSDGLQFLPPGQLHKISP